MIRGQSFAFALNENSAVQMLGTLLALCLLLSGCCGVLSLRAERQVVESLPTYPGAIRKGKFRTTWPDATPSAGILYAIDAEPEQILDFYESQLIEEGWTLEFEHGPSGRDEQGELLFYKGKFWCLVSVRGQARPYDVNVSVGPR